MSARARFCDFVHLFEEYGLKFGRCNEFRLGDALERMAQVSMANENGNVIGRCKEREHMLGCGERFLLSRTQDRMGRNRCRAGYFS